MAIEHLGVEHVRRAENAVARQRFCPLQGIVFAVLFKGVRHAAARGVAGANFYRLYGPVSPLAAALGTIQLLPCTACDFTAATGAAHRRVAVADRIAHIAGSLARS